LRQILAAGISSSPSRTINAFYVSENIVASAKARDPLRRRLLPCDRINPKEGSPLRAETGSHLIAY